MKFSDRAFLLKTLSGLMFYIAVLTAAAQVDEDVITEETPVTVEETMENITEIMEEEVDFTEFAELFDKLRNNPINLNKTNFNELKQIPFLTDIQIFNLLEHIRKYGNLATIYELQTIEGFTPQIIQNILPFVVVTTDFSRRRVTPSDIISNGKHQLFVRYSQVLQEQTGYSEISDEEYALKPNSRYLGSPAKIFSRYRFTYYNSMSMGVTAEKDPGEEFFKGSQPNGFDFYSAHFWMKNIGIFKTLALGDFNLSFGQGLGLMTGLSFGKSSDIATVKKSGRGITPYTSVEENNYLRGAAASFEIGKFEVFGFASYKRRDANLVTLSDTLDSEEFYFTSLNTTGLHRTPSELEKKNILQEQLYGGRVEYKSYHFQAGALGYVTSYEHPLNRNLSEYNKFEFNGQQLFVMAADYNYIRRNMNIFGEIARSDNGGLAMLQGMLITPAPNLSLGINYRNYQKNYQSLYASGFGESSKTANEQGLYAGIETRLHPKWIFNGYVDMFSFPWLRYRVDAPSNGHDMLAQITYRHSRTASFYFRYRQKNKFLNGTESLIRDIVLTEKNNYRIHAQYAISPSVTLKNRAEFVTYIIDGNPKNGFMLYQDVTWRPKQTPWALSVRYALFDTDTYDERIYVYENDVLYAYSIPSYYYKGSRAYVLVKYSLGRNIDLWFRYAQTYYSNRQTIGSGLDEVQGKLKSEIKLQMRLKF
jgi:hypothetical protein